MSITLSELQLRVLVELAAQAVEARQASGMADDQRRLDDFRAIVHAVEAELDKQPARTFRIEWHYQTPHEPEVQPLQWFGEDMGFCLADRLELLELAVGGVYENSDMSGRIVIRRLS